MKKDSFLDTNIIFHYSNYTNLSSKIIKECYFFIKNKSGNFILCWTILKELNEIIKKRARLHRAIIEKIKDSSYSFEDSSLVSSRDVSYAKKLYVRLKDTPESKVEYIFNIERNTSELRIQKFLQFNVDERVIPINQIDGNLVSKIHEIISNHADCKILASAIQLQDTREIFLFVTADSKDLDPNGYKYLKEHLKINCPNEKYKFPELLNLMFTN